MAKKPRQELVQDVAKSNDLHNLLDHISWHDDLEPQILSYREGLVKRHVKATLGEPPVHGAPLERPEALAGKIAGIDWTLGLFRKVLREGDKADEALRAYFDDQPVY